MNTLNQLTGFAAMITRFGLVTTRFVFSTIVAAGLIAAWAITAPLFQCYDACARRIKREPKGRT